MEEQVSQHYKAMLDSVWLINSIIANEEMINQSDEQKKECIDRNTKHLELMVSKSFWTTEDMEPINLAINNGNLYLTS
jgi:hypothetical protein